MQKKVNRKEKQTHSPNNDYRPKIIGLCILAGVLYLFLNRTPSQAPVRKSEVLQAKSPQSHIELLPPKIENELSENSLQEMRMASVAADSFGIKGLAVKVNDGKLKIPLAFESQKLWCRGGDLDTFSFLIADENSKEILISIEPLTHNKKGDMHYTSLKNLVGGLQKTFEVPIDNDLESLGLFICRDKAKTRSCRDKEYKSHSEIAAKIADRSTAAETKKKDYLLYFQNFLVHKGQLVTFSNEKISKEATAELRTYLAKTYKLNGKDFDAAWKINSTLRSKPAVIKDNKIFLDLPHNDPRCLKGKE